MAGSKRSARSQTKAAVVDSADLATCDSSGVIEQESQHDKMPGALTSLSVDLEDGQTNTALSQIMTKEKAKYLVLVVYPKANTPGCTKQTAAFEQALPELRSLGCAVLGASLDSATAQAKFAKSLNYHLAVKAKELLTAFDCLDISGKIIRSVIAIDDSGSIIYKAHKVKPEPSVEDFLTFLRTMKRQLTTTDALSAEEPIVEEHQAPRKAKVSRAKAKAVAAATVSSTTSDMTEEGTPINSPVRLRKTRTKTAAASAPSKKSEIATSTTGSNGKAKETKKTIAKKPPPTRSKTKN